MRTAINPEFFAANEPEIVGIRCAVESKSAEMSKQAIGELRGFACALRRGKSGLTAAQLDHVCDLATLYLVNESQTPKGR